VNSETDFEKRDYQDPYANVGDCLLMDYRLYHAGLANKSDKVRPILYITYFRPWFKDFVNYHKHPSLLIDEAEYEKVHPADKQLFSNATVRRKE
jgi:ectoine hydroxylase-related dioxygenase (phytanoyl-CoA dioxygenase family)